MLGVITSTRAGGWSGLCLAAAMGLALCGCNGASDGGADAKKRPALVCPSGAAVETGGSRRLALIVGVDDYASPSVSDLHGTVNDAWAMRDLLVGEGGYGFPEENVCLLTNAAATTASFEEHFGRALASRARPGDVVVVYFAGHGSQTPDLNGDEPDEWDETLLFHDARHDGVLDFTDDEFHFLIETLDEEAHVVVILDSCNSSTAVRRVGQHLNARFQPPDDTRREGVSRAASPDRRGDQAGGLASEWRGGMIAVSAAADGTSAIEKKGRGVFTTALVRVLGDVGREPITYAQAAPRVRKLVAAESYQTPYFQGRNLAAPVFGNASRAAPRAWRVTSAGEELRLEGPPLPGLGVDAELRIYEGSLFGEALQDPGRSKGTVVVESMDGPAATGRLIARAEDGADISAGDIAVLVRPAPEFTKIALSLRPASSPGGVDAARASAIVGAIAAHPDARQLVDVVGAEFDFELATGADGRLQLVGPENRVRRTFEGEDEAEAVAENLWTHAVQRALLKLSSEGAGRADDAGPGDGRPFVLVENETLRVRAVPADRRHQTECARGEWENQRPNELQTIPLCSKWHVEIELSDDAPVPLLVGGALLSTNGSIFALPSDGRQIRLEPGDTVRLENGPSERFVAQPPVDIADTIVIFGTLEHNQVPWHLLASRSDRADRSAALATSGPLFRVLQRYLAPGVRGRLLDEGVETGESAWTMTTVPVVTAANAGFREPVDRAARPADAREYTIPSFDIRPYLPERADSSLYRVLSVADGLARYSDERNDGVPYKQHAWTEGSDRANLAKGIDCSRAIWYAFTRAGEPYATGPRSSGYLATAEMAGSASRMTDAFDSCDDDPNLQLGDVIVYRDEGANEGHTVMVIDPAKRIAWGSHGWDGNEDDTGVEYQMIKPWREWKRWDKDAMRRVACWRHRSFVAGAAGVALEHACDTRRSCGRFSPPLPSGGDG